MLLQFQYCTCDFSVVIHVCSPNAIALALCFFDDILRHNVT